jgi:membrane-associated phospholipid phosphatase
MTPRDRNMVIGSIAALVLVLFSYALVDRTVAMRCQNLDQSIIDVFQWITEWGKSTGYLIGFFILFIFFKYAKGRHIPANHALFLFISIALSGLITDMIKPVVGRLRPKMFLEANLYGFDFFHTGWDYNSLPSGHATTVFSLAMALSLFYPKFRLPLFCFALIVGASRVIITAHYVSDVLAGAYVGIMTVLFLVHVYGRYDWKYGELGLNTESHHA